MQTSIIIHLIGSPGVGKYTIGSQVARLVGARLVDNHSVANVIFNLLDQDGIKPLPPAVWPRVAQVRGAVLDTLMHVSPPELSFVLTNYMRGEDAGEEAAFQEVVAVAEVRGSTFVPVILSCETPELLKRVVREDRRDRMKLVDPTEARRLNDEVPRFRSTHPNTLELDVTAIAPGAAAEMIVDWARRCQAVEAPK
ncbi:MAG: hypothetical protein ACRDHF_05390 [Tepidiformaceae bacterium]